MAWSRSRRWGAMVLFAGALPVVAGAGGALLAGVQTAAAAGATLYVTAARGTDANACTAAHACKTLERALTLATTANTVYLEPGTYKETSAAPNVLTHPSVKVRSTTGTLTGAAVTTITAAGNRFGLVANATGATVLGITVKNAGQSGILVSPPTSATKPAGVGTVTISDNVIETNDKCATTPAVAAHTATTNCTTPTPFSDYGEGLHLMSVSHSTVTTNTVEHNFGGILVTDEMGPSSTDKISGNNSSTNVGDCGITLASHNTAAVVNPVFTHTAPPATYGKPDPTAGGVYTITVTANHATNNGAAGILTAGGPPGTAVYHNTITGNTADGNGLAGYTLHSHAPFQDMNTNVVTGNTFVHDALHGLSGAPGDGTATTPAASMDQSAGIQLLGAVAPVTGTTVTSNTVSTSFYGIWASPHVVAASTIATNTISVTSGGVAIYSEPTSNGGYWMGASDGGVFSNGNLTYHGSVPGTGASISNGVGIAATADGGGYWEATANGTVYAFGDAQRFGTLPSQHTSVSDIVGIAAMPTGGGYYLVGADGGVFTFGNAVFSGSEGGKHLNKPVVGMAVTPGGKGYWLVAADGGIFTFGSATFQGSEGGKVLNKPVVGMSTTPTGSGYWEVASDGGLFSFGKAVFYGSMGGTHLNKPVVGMAAAPDGKGYWLVASDGGVFTFGSATFQGSVPGQHVSVTNVVGMATNI